MFIIEINKIESSKSIVNLFVLDLCFDPNFEIILMAPSAGYS
jgi:hypothetical protein